MNIQYIQNRDMGDDIFGDEEHQVVARKALPILIEQAKVRDTITYGDLAQRLDISRTGSQMSKMLDSIVTTLYQLGVDWQEDLPRLTALIVKRSTGYPGFPTGVSNERFDAEFERIYNYPKWDAVQHTLLSESEIMQSKKNDSSIYDSFQGMLDIAEFAATRVNERRAVEFKIFISYMTPLILALYYVIKLDPELLADISWWIIGGGALVYLISVHLIYVFWQIGIAVAMANDAWRRNFYLAKSECLLHHLSKDGKNTFCPDDTAVTVDLGSEKNECTEKELFEKTPPKPILVPNFWGLYEHKNKICKDSSRMLVVLVPTMLVAFLVLTLLFKKSYLLP